MKRKYFPFSAIVGQEELKKALLLNAVNPRIGGMLVRGEKGTAKSTAVRALGELLPQQAESSGGKGTAVVTLSAQRHGRDGCWRYRFSGNNEAGGRECFSRVCWPRRMKAFSMSTR